MNKVLAVVALAIVTLFVVLSQPVSAGQDGPGQLGKVGYSPPHYTNPPLLQLGQDGPGQ